MNLGIFNISFEQCIRFLSYCNLFRMRGLKRFQVSDEFKRASLSRPYFEVYNIAKRNGDFDILLQDESIFQYSLTFAHDTKLASIRYAFFENPQEYITYEEFLSKSDYSIDEAQDVFYEYYDQYLL